MGNQREIRQVSPRDGLGVVIAVREGRRDEVLRVLGDTSVRHFYTFFCPAGVRIAFPNLDGPDVDQDPQDCDVVVIQSGGKMWCGYEAFVQSLRELAPFLEDAKFFVADEDWLVDEADLRDGVLHFRRVGEGYVDVTSFLAERRIGAAGEAKPSGS
ncbi:hypothetical protein A7A76_10395 [Lysobacter enzymogenes]|uniref:hypothetical protein n=1 Tax=Lysobacter enzymogenes TaxID=69 RepID=UPI0019D07D3F|nr:hypothetical protein [Lysobacter enzymogenes]MBN7135164.1 hypothetical protein [Lysobacter enzymogenes]